MVDIRQCRYSFVMYEIISITTRMSAGHTQAMSWKLMKADDRGQSHEWNLIVVVRMPVQRPHLLPFWIKLLLEGIGCRVCHMWWRVCTNVAVWLNASTGVSVIGGIHSCAAKCTDVLIKQDGNCRRLTKWYYSCSSLIQNANEDQTRMRREDWLKVSFRNVSVVLMRINLL